MRVRVHLEDLLRSNIGLLMAAEASGDDSTATESALVVGQQVLDVNGKRCDLVFLTDGGDLAVVELKRDQAAMTHRSEALEFQAVRYAASLATIRTPDDLVTLMFAKYVERHRPEFDDKTTTQLTNVELAQRRLAEFLQDTKAAAGFNRRQRIYLVATSFSSDALSAAAWLAQSGVDIHCVTARPYRLGEDFFLEFNESVGPRDLKDLFVPVGSSTPGQSGQKSLPSKETRVTRRRGLPRFAEMVNAGVIDLGAILELEGPDGSHRAKLTSASGEVEVDGRRMSATEWGSDVKNGPRSIFMTRHTPFSPTAGVRASGSFEPRLRAFSTRGPNRRSRPSGWLLYSKSFPLGGFILILVDCPGLPEVVEAFQLIHSVTIRILGSEFPFGLPVKNKAVDGRQPLRQILRQRRL